MTEQSSEQNAIAESLTDKNLLFIHKLVHGKSESGNPLTVYEAYQQAGYQGSIHAAYQLKSRLERELMQAQMDKGASKSDIFASIANLMNLPVVDRVGAPVSGISVGQKLKLLSIATAAHKEMEPQKKNITAININLGDQASIPTNAIDAEIIQKGVADEGEN